MTSYKKSQHIRTMPENPSIIDEYFEGLQTPREQHIITRNLAPLIHQVETSNRSSQKSEQRVERMRQRISTAPTLTYKERMAREREEKRKIREDKREQKRKLIEEKQKLRDIKKAKLAEVRAFKEKKKELAEQKRAVLQKIKKETQLKNSAVGISKKKALAKLYIY